MATRRITGGASRPSTILAFVVALAIGSAPLWTLMLAGGQRRDLSDTGRTVRRPQATNGH